MSLAYVNGSFMPLSEARVPVLDRGYLFGDGVYEVIPAYQGKAFRAQAHLQRLERSLAAIRLDNPLPRARWMEIIARLLSHAPQARQQLYLQVTRGVQAVRSHAMPAKPRPGVLAYAAAASARPEQLEHTGVGAITAADLRWARCDIKSIALLGHVMCQQQAVDAGCNEAILHRDGRVSEGASSNVFAVFDGTIVTPPVGEWLLAGVTRAVVIELAQAAGLPLLERHLSLAELRSATEIWITSSTRELYPVTQLDKQPVGSGVPGSRWQRLATAYRQLVQVETGT